MTKVKLISERELRKRLASIREMRQFKLRGKKEEMRKSLYLRGIGRA